MWKPSSHSSHQAAGSSLTAVHELCLTKRRERPRGERELRASYPLHVVLGDAILQHLGEECIHEARVIRTIGPWAAARTAKYADENASNVNVVAAGEDLVAASQQIHVGRTRSASRGMHVA